MTAPLEAMLMFSGGRDSTLAAVRLADSGVTPILVTITSNHLVGIARVKDRLRELSSLLPSDSKWVIVEQPTELRTDTSFYEQTCLSCHHAYVVACGVLARQFGSQQIAFGYASYQSDWPEQTPLAVERLGMTLASHGLSLKLPVYDLASREEAMAQLAARGLSTLSLEQKCLRQISNVRLSEDRLRQQIELWERAIDQSLRAVPAIPIAVTEQGALGAFRHEEPGTC